MYILPHEGKMVLLNHVKAKNCFADMNFILCKKAQDFFFLLTTKLIINAFYSNGQKEFQPKLISSDNVKSDKI